MTHALRAAMLVALLCVSAPALAQRQPMPPMPPMLSPAQLQAELKARSGSDTIYFARQGYGLDTAAMRVLMAQAAWLRMNPIVMVRLEGHADQFDTRDYAFAIAERRAAAVRDFLITQGVSPARLSLASWGKERPGSTRIGNSMVGVGPRVVTTIR